MHVYRIKLYEYAMLLFFYCAWCIYLLYSVPTSFLKSAASAHLQEIRSTQNTWRHFCEFDAAQPSATQPVCEQVSSGVFAYAKCDGWKQRQGMRTQKEHVIAMFFSLLVSFSNLFLGVVEITPEPICVMSSIWNDLNGLLWMRFMQLGTLCLNVFFYKHEACQEFQTAAMWIRCTYLWYWFTIYFIFITCQYLLDILFGGFKNEIAYMLMISL